MSSTNGGEILQFIRDNIRPGDVKIIRKRAGVHYNIVNKVISGYRPLYEHRDRIIDEALALINERAESEARHKALIAKIQQTSTATD